MSAENSKSVKTKGNFQTFQLMMTKGQKGLDEIRDPDGSVFKRISPPIQDPTLLAEHKRGKKVFLTKQITKMTLGLGALSVGLAAMPYLYGVGYRAYKVVKEISKATADGLLAKKYQEIEEKAKASDLNSRQIIGQKIGWTVCTSASMAAEILAPRSCEVEEFIDTIKPVGACTAVFMAWVVAMVSYAYSIDDGSKWVVVDKSGKTVPIEM